MTAAADIHTLTGAYALYALPDDERRMFERHLDACDACAQEVREFLATTARLATGVPAVPSQEFRDRLMAHITTVRQLPPEGAAARHQTPARRPLYGTVTGIAAAGLLVLSVGLGGVALDARSELSDAQQRTQAISDVLGRPDAVLRTVELRGGATATVVAADGRAVFTASDLPDVADNRTYQLWIVADEDVASAGLLDPEDGVTQKLVTDLPAGSSLAVSVEPEGGSEAPTTDPLGLVPTV